MSKKQGQRLLSRQRKMGIAMLIISAIILMVCATGKSPADKDCTAILFTLPISVFFLTAHKIIIYH